MTVHTGWWRTCIFIIQFVGHAHCIRVFLQHSQGIAYCKLIAQYVFFKGCCSVILHWSRFYESDVIQMLVHVICIITRTWVHYIYLYTYFTSNCKYSISSIEKYMFFFLILFANNLLYERKESNAKGMDFFLQIILINYVFVFCSCNVQCLKNNQQYFFVFDVSYSPLLLLFCFATTFMN